LEDVDRFGVLGAEDLGGGLKANFKLESGFSGATGAQQYTNAMFGRTAYVGLSQPTYGEFRVGRQYPAYYQALAPYSVTNFLSGYLGAHPGDIDGMDTVYRSNNEIFYQSPQFFGFSASGSYSLGGVPDSLNAGSTWSAALQYFGGPIGAAVAFQRANNSTNGGGAWGADSTLTNGGAQPGVSAINNGYQTAQAQQRFAVDGTYYFTSAWDLSFVYSNTQYIPGIRSAFRDTAIFNIGGLVLHWKALPALDLAAGYNYTWATHANGIESAARYQQFNLGQVYLLSKRTSLYAAEGYQRASGQTLGTAGAGHIQDATASLGDGQNGAPSSNRNQFSVAVGILHKF
jgi:predicted porin